VENSGKHEETFLRLATASRRWLVAATREKVKNDISIWAHQRACVALALAHLQRGHGVGDGVWRTSGTCLAASPLARYASQASLVGERHAPELRGVVKNGGCG